MWVVKGMVRRWAGVRVRLFCFPYAGASAALYRSWVSAFPSSVDVCPVELPGRLSRLSEAPFTRIEPLVEALTRGLRPLLDVPFAVFGYSMGALVGYEWTRHLLREGLPGPQSIIVAARGAPQLPPRFSHAAGGCDDDQLSELILQRYGPRISAVLREPELRRIVLGMMRADLELLDNYVYAEAAPLRVPIMALGGEDDRTVPRDDVLAWRLLTSGPFQSTLLPGDHFFLLDRPGQVIELVERELQRRIDRPTSDTEAYRDGSMACLE